MLDASVAVRWYLDRPASQPAQRVLKDMAAGANAVVPALWRPEVLNALLTAERRGILGAADLAGALVRIDQLAQTLTWVEDGAVPAQELAALARRHRLTSYDALYLWLAQTQALPLATLDSDLRRAAVSAGVQLFAADGPSHPRR